MSKLLFDEQPLVIDHVLARLLGLNAAIVVQQIHYWLEINKKTKKNFYNDRYWVFNSFAEWQKNNFDFWAINTIKRTFANLEEQGILLIGNFNKDRRDRTKWYTIDYQKLEGMVQCKNPKWDNGTKYQNGILHNTKMVPPLPENTITEITTENNIININNSLCNAPSLSDEEVRKNDFKRVKDYYSTFIEGKNIITFNIEKQLYDYFRILGVELVLFAIDKACEYNVKNFKYVRGILNNLVKNNITTLEEAKEFKPTNNKDKKDPKDPNTMTQDEITDYIFSD